MTQKRQLPEQIASHTYKKHPPKEGFKAIEKQVGQAEQAANERGGVEEQSLPPVRSGEPVSKQEAQVGAGRVPARSANKQEAQISNRESAEPAATARPRQRIVTYPTDPSTAWNAFAQRQERRRRVAARQRSKTYIRLEARTYARTGSWATGERTRNGMRRPLPTHRRSPIPTRSGRNGARRGWFWKLLGVVAGLIGLGLATNFVFTSTAFRIEQVNVVGTHNDVLISSIQRMGMQGQNIFLVNVPDLKEQIEALPLVSSASLSKQWPNQLTVTVKERIPALLWQTPQGTYSIDSQGVVIAPVNGTTGLDHLKIVVAGMNTNTGKNKGQGSTIASGNVQPLRTGMHLNAAEISFALAVFKSLPQVTGINTFKLRYDGTMYPDTTSGPWTPGSRGSFVVESPDGWIAYLGNAADANPLENRLIALQQILLLSQKEGQRLATIDVRYGLHPVYTVAMR
jgi:hypothetical protein